MNVFKHDARFRSGVSYVLLLIDLAMRIPIPQTELHLSVQIDRDGALNAHRNRGAVQQSHDSVVIVQQRGRPISGRRLRSGAAPRVPHQFALAAEELQRPEVGTLHGDLHASVGGLLVDGVAVAVLIGVAVGIAVAGDERRKAARIKAELFYDTIMRYMRGSN